VRYASMYIHCFALCALRKIMEATQLNQRYRRYEEIDNVPDRLRWLRYSRGLRHKDVAQSIGMSSSSYKRMEKGITQNVSLENAEVLAQFYTVPLTDFINQYN